MSKRATPKARERRQALREDESQRAGAAANPDRSELHRLRRENARLRAEVEELKRRRGR